MKSRHRRRRRRRRRRRPGDSGNFWSPEVSGSLKSPDSFNLRKSLSDLVSVWENVPYPHFGGLVDNVWHWDSSCTRIQIIQHVKSTSGRKIRLHLDVIVQTQWRIAINKVSETLIVVLWCSSKTIEKFRLIDTVKPIGNPMSTFFLDGVRVTHVGRRKSTHTIG